MQVQTSEGIFLTLTEEQIHQIDMQVKAKQVPQLITDRVKSWEDAFNIVRPKIYVTDTGRIEDLTSTDIIADLCHQVNVSSMKRAKSVLAYCQLSVIADALNEEWVPDWDNDDKQKCLVYYSYENKEFVADWVYSYKSASVYFESEELAQYTIAQFPDLWKQYFMID